MTAAITTGIAWLDTLPMREAILAPAGGAVPVGPPADGIDDFHEISGELMKRGTLQHGDIRWSWVAEEATRLIRQSKDIRLLSAMLYALQPQDGKPVFPVALVLAAQFCASWLRDAHPQGRMKPKLAARLADQLIDSFPKDVALFEQAGLYEACVKVAGAVKPDGQDYPELAAFFVELPERLAKLKEAAAPVPREAPERGSSAAASARPKSGAPAEAPKTSDLNLDPANERALKQSLVSVADFLLQIDADHPLSYRLRRYATWYGVVSPPPIKSGQRTVLQAVSEETVDRYRTAVERAQADVEVVTKLERTCHLQPFWIEGQFLACRLALAAGRESVAQAIHEEALRFVRSVAGLSELAFSEGTPFIPKDVGLWLETRPAPEPEPEPQAQPQPKSARKAAEDASGSVQKPVVETGFIAVDRQFQNTIRNVRSAAKKGDLAEALGLLDQARENAEGLRAMSLWEIVAMESLSEWGMKANVSSQARRLYNTIENAPVSEWEPELLRRLMRLI